jgi:hypothetical protein
MSTSTQLLANDSHDGLVVNLPRPVRSPSRRRLWAGRILSGFVVAFLLFDSTIKLLQIPAVRQASRQLGYSDGSIFAIGVVLLACCVTYLVPRLSLVGALLITGYLGGAIATHVRVGDPLLSHTLFPIYVAAMVWGGLYLRDDRVRALIAPRRPGAVQSGRPGGAYGQVSV